MAKMTDKEKKAWKKKMDAAKAAKQKGASPKKASTKKASKLKQPKKKSDQEKAADAYLAGLKASAAAGYPNIPADKPKKKTSKKSSKPKGEKKQMAKNKNAPVKKGPTKADRELAKLLKKNERDKVKSKEDSALAESVVIVAVGAAAGAVAQSSDMGNSLSDKIGVDVAKVAGAGMVGAGMKTKNRKMKRRLIAGGAGMIAGSLAIGLATKLGQSGNRFFDGNRDNDFGGGEVSFPETV